MLELKVKIEQQACFLFSRFGIKSITMDELAATMGISKKTIYRCFTNKHALVESVYLPLLQEAEAACKASIADAANAIEECLLCWVNLTPVITLYRQKAYSDIQRDFFELSQRYQQFKQTFLRGLVEKNIERGQAEGLYRPSIHPGIIAAWQTTMIEAFNSEMPFAGKYANSTADAQLLLHHLNGLVTPKGAALLETYQQEKQIAP